VRFLRIVLFCPSDPLIYQGKCTVDCKKRIMPVVDINGAYLPDNGTCPDHMNPKRSRCPNCNHVHDLAWFFVYVHFSSRAPVLIVFDFHRSSNEGKISSKCALCTQYGNLSVSPRVRKESRQLLQKLLRDHPEINFMLKGVTPHPISPPFFTAHPREIRRCAHDQEGHAGRGRSLRYCP
jgi:hypothetical protein